MPRKKKGEETEDLGIENGVAEPSEGLLEAEEARKHKQKRKRGSKSMTIPEVLRFLNGEELLMLMDYLHNNYYLKWFMDVDTARYTNIFAQLFATYGQQPQMQVQEQEQTQETQTYTQTYTPMYRPSNPLDALFEAFAGRVLDRVLDKVIQDPRLQEEIRSIVKASVTGAVQSIAPDLARQALEGGAPPPEAPPPE